MAKNWGIQTPILQERPRRGLHKHSPFIGLGLFMLAFWFLLRHYIIVLSAPQWYLELNSANSLPRCPQAAPLLPSRRSKELDEMETYLESNAFQGIAIKRLTGAVRIPTQSFDDMGKVGTDPRWDTFYEFAEYLAKTFPLVHASLELEKINTHGLLYTWVGNDKNLKPNLLMAHQDVVPVADSTVKQWTHPPFSGYFDGKYIWGRGSNDCKNQLIAILSAVEALISADFTPRRTLILSFGFDEEISGQHGAKYLSDYLLSKYGHNSIAAIVDEGAVNVESWGAAFAVPGVAEKYVKSMYASYVRYSLICRSYVGVLSILISWLGCLAVILAFHHNIMALALLANSSP
jgi:Gly-Xaa carboxypeptidase